jgi:ectoine hydroxylase-related dioxygenase (phytanoyl-CoA dioxygenase family)
MDVEGALARFRQHGYVILERLIPQSTCDELSHALAPFEAGRPMGRNNFEGERSHRVYSLAGKGDAFMRLAEHPFIVAMLDRLLMPNWLLSNLQSIRLHPGESEQPRHTDDAFYAIPRPRPTLAVSTIWAIEDFTTDNGATELVPGSHRWSGERPDERSDVPVQAVMPAGSVVVFDGATWHRGGANRSSVTRLAISPQYCQPWLRTQESQLLIAPPAIAANYSARARAMLGYSIHPPFLGQVDGMHPLRLIDPDYRTRKTHDHEIADQVLERPKSVWE